jgi:hypothetical protein
MKYTAILIALLFCSVGFAQKAAPKPTPKKTPDAVPVKSSIVETDELGRVEGRTYTNTVYDFQITFPDTWLVPDRDFEAYMKSQGHDISLKAPDSVGKAGKIQIDRALEKVKVLVTGYRALPGMADNAILRISVEDLMRSQFAVMKLPADFKYSETQAEKLGAKQFAFIDTSSNTGKKRMYATVRNGFAIMFTLTFTKPEDLATMRQILAGGDFALTK